MIVFIAPFSKLRDQADKVIDENGIENVITLIGNLSEGVRVARNYLKEDESCVFVSRGGTASFIREQMGVPVVEIQISYLDILSQLRSLSSQYNRITAVGFESMTSPVAAISRIMNYNVRVFPIQTENAISTAFDEIQEWGGEIVLGDYIAYRHANAAGLDCQIIDSGYESIKEALQKASLIDMNLQDQVRRTNQFRAILDSVREGVLCTDPKGLITQVNERATRLLNKPEDSLLGREIKEVFPTLFSGIGIKDVRHDKDSIALYEGKYLAVRTTYLKKDWKSTGMVVLIQRPDSLHEMDIEMRKKIKGSGFSAKYRFDDICFKSKEMGECIIQAREFSKTLSNLIIYGETGTGKEMIAQSIHNSSEVHSGPFVAVNCAAFPIQLLESELFGYVEGAFSGAKRGGQIGLFEIAQGGTIFLDEIGEMCLELQTKLLRVLQEHEIRRVGGDKIIPVNARIIAATNTDLKKAIHDKKFREDLFYRLNVLDIYVPPLRKRKDDILPIFDMYLSGQSSGALGIKDLSDEFKDSLLNYDWPGNVRELENVAGKFSVFLSIGGEHYAEEKIELNIESDESSDSDSYISTKGTLKDISERIVHKVFGEEGNNISRTAKRLDVDRNTLRRKLSLFSEK